jgi:hypothetical protein
MDLDPGGENVSFLVQVVPHTRVRYFFNVAPANFRSLVRFCFAIVDMTGQLQTNGLSPRTTKWFR